MITGFHGLHVTIGAGLMLVMAWRTGRGEFGPTYHTPLEVGALYWHLVDIVWIFVYPLIYLVGTGAMSKRTHAASSTPVPSLRSQLGAWVALLLLLALTAGSALMPMGMFNAVANMAIAVAKALLVMVFFMKLRTDQPLVRIVAAAGFAWLALADRPVAGRPADPGAVAAAMSARHRWQPVGLWRSRRKSGCARTDFRRFAGS